MMAVLGVVQRRYAHSPVELLDRRDLMAAIAFVEEVVHHPPPFQ